MTITKGRWITKGEKNSKAQMLNIITVNHKDEKVFGDAGEILTFKQLLNKWEPLDDIRQNPDHNAGQGNGTNSLSNSSLFNGLKESNSHEEKNVNMKEPVIVSAEIIQDDKPINDTLEEGTDHIIKSAQRIKKEAAVLKSALTTKQRLIAEALEVNKENYKTSDKIKGESLVVNDVDIDFNFNLTDIVKLSKTFNVSIDDVADVILSDDDSRDTLKSILKSIIEAVSKG